MEITIDEGTENEERLVIKDCSDDGLSLHDALRKDHEEGAKLKGAGNCPVAMFFAETLPQELGKFRGDISSVEPIAPRSAQQLQRSDSAERSSPSQLRMP